jgi:hypothetical protein
MMKTCLNHQQNKAPKPKKKSCVGEEKVQDERTQEVLAKLMKNWFITR